MIAFGRAHEIERLSSDGEVERRNLDREHESVEERRHDVEGFGEATQLELGRLEIVRGHE